ITLSMFSNKKKLIPNTLLKKKKKKHKRRHTQKHGVGPPFLFIIKIHEIIVMLFYALFYT
ncbi:hypothetical protein, partial [Bacillus thuringiensis]|uniref:hypothetical protein n=1 Tax=Bacillus thuringiensis TaxID=1428 RepID=UPI001D18B1B0